MKLYARINYILLGTLWCMAIVLGLDFCLNTVYNFNMFSSAHWTYIATAQAAGQQIATGFYIAITLAIILGIFGLYMLFRPRFRKIILPKPEPAPMSTPDITPPAQDDISQTPKNKIETTPIIERPPRLHIQTQNTSRTMQPKTQQRDTQQNTAQKTTPQNPRYTHEIREIFEKNNYIVFDAKKISNTNISLIALGSDETLWIGACDISHEQMADVILEFQSVFNETLQDIEIDINAFIINPTDNDIVESILDFASLDELSNTINENPNTEPEDNAESDNMDAFRGYIETVITYLGNKQ